MYRTPAKKYIRKIQNNLHSTFIRLLQQHLHGCRYSAVFSLPSLFIIVYCRRYTVPRLLRPPRPIPGRRQVARSVRYNRGVTPLPSSLSRYWSLLVAGRVVNGSLCLDCDLSMWNRKLLLGSVVLWAQCHWNVNKLRRGTVSDCWQFYTVGNCVLTTEYCEMNVVPHDQCTWEYTVF